MRFAPCFYPTTVIFLDDDKCFFDDMAYQLSKDRATYLNFLSSSLFLEYLSLSPAPRFLQEYVTFVDHDLPDHYRHNANVVDFHHIAQDPQRFQEISVVVLDYDMPFFNGLEVSRQITNPHTKKILLTSIADEPLAIEAFHKGLIDAYIRKNNPLMIHQLNAHIYRLQKAYFIDAFAPFTQTLHTYHRDVEQYPIFTKQYQDLLETLIQKHHIVEYYLCEGVGTCLLINKQGQSFYFYCRNENDYKSLQWEEMSAQLRELFDNRRYLPHTPASERIKATKVEGPIPFYYAVQKAEMPSALKESFAQHRPVEANKG